MLPQIPILVYHKIDTRFEYSISRITPQRFESHLDWLYDNHYKTITVSEVASQCLRGDPVPEKTVAIAFDDGFENIYDYAFPMLKDRNMIATVYMIAGFAGKEDRWDVKIGWKRFRHLSWDQIGEMSEAGFEIGSHTVNHPDLTRIDEDQLAYELSESRNMLERELGVTVHSFSYPFGAWNSEVSDRVSKAGYSSAVLVRNRTPVHHTSTLMNLQGSCIYSTTGIQRVRDILHGHPLSPFSALIERGIGWCASRTPLVKGPPIYSDS